MQRVNIHSVPLDQVQDQPGYSWTAAVLGPQIGASAIGATLYELPPGQATFPYHYEYGCEEWLLVVTGSPTLRDPDGSHLLEPGDVVCFREGPDGGHRLVNEGEETSRVILFSTKGRPAIAVFPDSNKLLAFTGDERDDVIVRREAVDYWDREENSIAGTGTSPKGSSSTARS
jgi:uncharacterized cupin superfamily protein